MEQFKGKNSNVFLWKTIACWGEKIDWPLSNLFLAAAFLLLLLMEKWDEIVFTCNTWPYKMPEYSWWQTELRFPNEGEYGSLNITVMK